MTEQTEQKVSDYTIKETEMESRLAELKDIKEIPVGGETKIEEDAIATLAGVAASEIEGVAALGTTSALRGLAERITGAERRARGVEAEVGRKEAIVDLQFRVMYGYNIPEVVVKVRQNVAQRLLDLSGLITKEINIQVTGMEFPKKTQGRVE